MHLLSSSLPAALPVLTSFTLEEIVTAESICGFAPRRSSSPTNDADLVLARRPAPEALGLTRAVDSLANHMASVQARNEHGLHALFKACERRVFSCAMGIVRREEIAHEVVSTSFLQLWTEAANFDPSRGSVLAWLMLIARSRALDALRRIATIQRCECSLADTESLDDFQDADALDPMERQNRERIRIVLHAAIQELPPPQRHVLLLTAFQGLTHREAAQHMRIPLGTVKSHARRGLLALRAACLDRGLTTA